LRKTGALFFSALQVRFAVETTMCANLAKRVGKSLEVLQRATRDYETTYVDKTEVFHLLRARGAVQIDALSNRNRS
jgi:hypothetical protein